MWTRPSSAKDLYKTFLAPAAALCLPMGSAFENPAVAWYWRTKEKQQSDRRVRFLAHHDALTGLANRPNLIERLGMALAVLPERGGSSPCTSSLSIA
jgi:hypothetical protein